MLHMSGVLREMPVFCNQLMKLPLFFNQTIPRKVTVPVKAQGTVVSEKEGKEF